MTEDYKGQEFEGCPVCDHCDFTYIEEDPFDKTETFTCDNCNATIKVSVVKKIIEVNK